MCGKQTRDIPSFSYTPLPNHQQNLFDSVSNIYPESDLFLPPPCLNSALSHHHPHLSAPSGPFEQYMLLSSSALSPPVSSPSYSGEKLKPLKMFYKTFFFLTSNSSPGYSVCSRNTDIIVVSRACQVSPRATSLALPSV